MTNFVITNAGLAEIVNAENNGTAPVVLSKVGIGTGKYTATADRTALAAEFKQFSTIKGGNIGDNIININVEDTSTETYSVYEIGIYTDSGTLFAVCSHTSPLIEKASVSKMMIAIDIVLTNVNPDSITLGDANFLLNSATTEEQGIIELATEAEAKAGTDTHRAITPKTLDVTIEAHDNIVHRSGSETIKGQKTFEGSPIVKGSSPIVYIKQTDVQRGVIPTTAQLSGLTFTDADGKTLGQISQVIENDISKVQITVNKPDADSTDNAYLSLIYPNSGTPYATAPTPPENDASKKIATTEWVKNFGGAYLPLSGGKMTNNTAIFRSVDDAYISFFGGSSSGSGAQIDLCGKNHGNLPGAFQLHARNETTDKILIGEIDGDLKWDGKHIVRTVNGVLANNAGNVTLKPSTIGAAAEKHTHDYLPLTGGTVSGSVTVSGDVKIGGSIWGLDASDNISILADSSGFTGTCLILYNVNNAEHPGFATIQAADENNLASVTLQPDGTLKCNGKNIVRSVNNTVADTSGNVTLTPSTIGAAKENHTHDYLPLSGGTITANDVMKRNVSTGYLGLHGGTDANSGAVLNLCGKDHSTMPGNFQLCAHDGTSKCTLQGNANKTLQWDGKYVLNNSFQMNTDASGIILNSGTSSSTGANFRLYGKDSTTGAGQFSISANDGTNSGLLVGKPDGTLTWEGNEVERVVASSLTGSNFYIKYASGLIIQGGYATAALNSKVTMPIAFSNSNYIVQVQPTTSTIGTSLFMAVSGITTTYFNIQSDAGSATVPKTWLAIGY